MNYRTYHIEQSSPGFWVVTDPSQRTQSGAEPCMGVLETRKQAKEFVDELIAAAGHAIAQTMREMREKRANRQVSR